MINDEAQRGLEAARTFLERLLREGHAASQYEEIVEKLRGSMRYRAERSQHGRDAAEATLQRRITAEGPHAAIAACIAPAINALIRVIAANQKTQHTTYVHLLERQVGGQGFPRLADDTSDSATQYVALVPPSNIRHELFATHESKYLLRGLAIEKVPAAPTPMVRLHLYLAGRVADPTPNEGHYVYLTLETTGRAYCERFSVHASPHRYPEVSLGIEPSAALINMVSHGVSHNLDAIFPGARDHLVKDVAELPQFLDWVAASIRERAQTPGF